MNIFSVGEQMIDNWLHEWENRGMAGLYNRLGRGRKPTFDHEQQEQIKQWAQRYPRQLKRVLQKAKEPWNTLSAPRPSSMS